MKTPLKILTAGNGLRHLRQVTFTWRNVCDAALRDLAVFCQPGARVADLGCLHGDYAAAFAEAGYTVLGIEARQESYAICKARENPPTLTFTCDDARNLPAYGQFDAIFCSGLLYHLDEPAAFLAMLARQAPLLILQTHYSTQPNASNEGYDGHWYDDQPEERDVWGSWGNRRSFWLTKLELFGAMQAAGFELVFEQHDYASIIRAGEPHPGRSMFVGWRGAGNAVAAVAPYPVA